MSTIGSAAGGTTGTPTASTQAREIGASLSEMVGLQIDSDAREGLALEAESWFEVAEILSGLGL